MKLIFDPKWGATLGVAELLKIKGNFEDHKEGTRGLPAKVPVVFCEFLPWVHPRFSWVNVSSFLPSRPFFFVCVALAKQIWPHLHPRKKTRFSSL